MKLFDVCFSIVQQIYFDLTHVAVLIFGLLLLPILVVIQVMILMHRLADLGHFHLFDAHMTFYFIDELTEFYFSK